ncbi:MAG: molybdopterin cofactor-binding domain-containing protein [Gammaproteobacteria bacterium]|nr:molybdopterin cofactor-binding domain-containing protein [Gammaproteobacteria bacterium]
MLEFSLPAALADELGTLVGSEELNAYVKIASDGEITIFSPQPEMGQGVKTALPMIVAEEMGAKWEDVTVLQAEVDAERYGSQWSGGSMGIPRNFDLMRRMGASAREMLIGAASESMEVPRDELEARQSKIVHTTGQSLTFGQLAALAVKQPLPDPDKLIFKDQEDWTIIGTSVSSVDNLVIATGRAEFGIDTVIPNMQFATFMRCPKIGGKAVAFNEREIKSLPGVTDAFILEGNGKISELRSGVAIVGDDTWAVIDARNKLDVEWDESDASNDNWEAMVASAHENAGKPGGQMITNKGDVDAEFAKNSNRVHDAFYQFQFVAHTCAWNP